MSRIARNSVNGRLNRNTFCSGAEVVPVQLHLCIKLFGKQVMTAHRQAFSVQRDTQLSTSWETVKSLEIILVLHTKFLEISLPLFINTLNLNALVGIDQGLF